MDNINEEIKPDNLSAEQEAGLRGLMPDFEPPKGGDKNGKTEKESSAESIQMIGGLYTVVFGLMAARMGEHWLLTQDEVTMLAAPTVAVIEKYYPDAKMGVEAALVVSVFAVIVPRLMVKPPIEGEVVTDGNQSEHNPSQSE